VGCNDNPVGLYFRHIQEKTQVVDGPVACVFNLEREIVVPAGVIKIFYGFFLLRLNSDLYRQVLRYLNFNLSFVT